MFGYNGECKAACPLGTYPNTTSNYICINCPSYCSTCDYTMICTTCISDTMFNPYDSLCYKICPPGYYGDKFSNLCTKCHSSCLTCYGPT